MRRTKDLSADRQAVRRAQQNNGVGHGVPSKDAVRAPRSAILIRPAALTASYVHPTGYLPLDNCPLGSAHT